jgi:hypothetical protein
MADRIADLRAHHPRQWGSCWDNSGRSWRVSRAGWTGWTRWRRRYTVPAWGDVATIMWLGYDALDTSPRPRSTDRPSRVAHSWIPLSTGCTPATTPGGPTSLRSVTATVPSWSAKQQCAETGCTPATSSWRGVLVCTPTTTVASTDRVVRSPDPPDACSALPDGAACTPRLPPSSRQPRRSDSCAISRIASSRRVDGESGGQGGPREPHSVR